MVDVALGDWVANAPGLGWVWELEGSVGELEGMVAVWSA